jgi:branched-chain amino acid transport system permease protein
VLLLFQQVVNGLALGSVYALLAIGFSMIYGILRMMNFAHGDIYAFSTIFVAAMLMRNVPLLAVLLIGIVTGAGLAALVERVCYRPLRFVDRSVSMITALGAAFVLRNASEYFWGVRPSPFPLLLGRKTLNVGGVLFPVSGFLVLGLALGGVALFNTFLRRSRLGRGILLVAQDIPTSSLMGIPVNRTVVVVYALGGALGVVGGILYGSIYGVVFPSMGFVGTMKAFVAAIIGGIGNLSGALIAGLFLGIVETLVVVYGADLFGFPPGYRDGVAFVILIVFLLFRPNGLMGTRVALSESTSLASIASSGRGGTPTGLSVGRFTLPRWSVWTVIVTGALAFPQLVTDPYVIRIANLIMMYAIVVLGMNVVLGYCGQFHFGQAGFMAIGAYTTALVMLNWGTNFLLALALSGLVSLLFGLVIGVPTLRVRSDYLALVTFAFGEIVRLVLLNSEFSRGPMGLPGIPLPEIAGVVLKDNAAFFYYALALLVFSYVLCWKITRSFIGRAWKAIAADETVAEAVGIETGRYKILAFGLACFLGGIGGSYMATFMRFIAPNSFTVDQSVLILVMVVLGGLGNLPGSLVGAAVMIAAIEVLRPVAQFRIAFIGLLMIVIPVFRPLGLMSGGWPTSATLKGLTKLWPGRILVQRQP